MNKTHRIVWSEARRAYVVAHEKVAAHGKPSSTRTIVMRAAVAALCVLPAVSAQATCDPGANPALLCTGTIASYTNPNGTTITGGMTGGYDAVLVGTVVYPGPVITPGTITDFINDGTISAPATGTSYAIQVVGGSTITNLTNNGTIESPGNLAVFTVSTGGIGLIANLTNASTGTISGIGGGIYLTKGATTSLRNDGLIEATMSISAVNDWRGRGLYLDQATVATLENYGTIRGTGVLTQADMEVRSGFGALITTFINGQSASPLRYRGTLPTNYYTYFSNPTTYGKVAFSVAGTTTLSTQQATYTLANYGLRIATGQNYQVGTYTDVIVSDRPLSITTTTAAGIDYYLSARNGGLNWDLIIGSLGPVVSLSATTSTRALSNTPASAAASVIDANSTLLNEFVNANLTTNEQISNAVTQTLPLLTGGAQVATGAALTGMNRVVQARIESNRGLSSGDGFLGNKHLWAKPFGSWADQDDRNGVSGYKARTGGVAFGVDGVLSDTTRLGAALAYAKAAIDGNSSIAPNSAQVDVFQLIGYGSYTLNKDTEINFQAGLGQNKNEGTRRLLTWNTTAKADYSSLVATVGAGIGRTYALSEASTFTPSVRFDYVWAKDERYTEKGAGVLNLDVAERTSEGLVVALDGKVHHQLSNTLSLVGNLGVGYDILNERSSITAAYAGAPGAAFTTHGLDPSPWLARGGLGLVSTTVGGTEISLRYDVEYRADFLNQTASVKARWAF